MLSSIALFNFGWAIRVVCVFEAAEYFNEVLFEFDFRESHCVKGAAVLLLAGMGGQESECRTKSPGGLPYMRYQHR